MGTTRTARRGENGPAEGPRDRLLSLGPAALTDAELVAVLLGSGNGVEGACAIAARVVERVDLRRLRDVPIQDLLAVRGLGEARAAQLLAAAEVGRRLWPSDGEVNLVRGPADIYESLGDVRAARREHFVGFYLNARNQILRREILSVGSLNASIVHPREVFRPAIAVSAASLVLAHNHPSGDPAPSEEDLAITRRIVEAGRLLGIELLDHVVVARDAFVSLKERRLLS